MSLPKDFLKSIYLTGKDGLHLLEHFPRCGMRVASMVQGYDLENTVQKRIACLAVPLAVDRLSALLTHSNINPFGTLNKPLLSPPGWLFPVVWTILFVLMGIAPYLEVSGKPNRTDLTVYGIQLLFNFVWSISLFQHDTIPVFLYLTRDFVAAQLELRHSCFIGYPSRRDISRCHLV